MLGHSEHWLWWPGWGQYLMKSKSQREEKLLRSHIVMTEGSPAGTSREWGGGPLIGTPLRPAENERRGKMRSWGIMRPRCHP